MILLRYFDSMAGRLFLFLLIGVIGSSSLALGLADVRRKSDLEHINIVRLVDRVQDLVSLIDSAPKPLRDQMLREGILGLRPLKGVERIVGPDPEFTRVLASRLDPSSRAQKAVPQTCIQPSSRTSFYVQLSCWVISTKLADHTPITLVALSPRTDTFDLPRLDPIFLSILTITVSVLAFLASRMAAAPLRDLSRAARELGRDLDRTPLPERGPYEVRDAIRAFNLMQAKLRDHVVERTRILASITHDLQTPLTRLRLRIEKVADPALRSRLIDDLGGMLALVRQGLDYHRGNESEEPFVRLALDSLLDSVVEDAAEGGRPATLVQRSGYDIEGKPRALQRCLANLLDNALKYGGSAEVSARVEGDSVRIRIRDFGPGIPAEKLESVFEPFVRLETARPATGGVGLGLTIARALAQKSEAELVLANHPQGGLEACLTIRRGLIPSEAAPSQASAA
jgi:signal transduction histidine kinase